LFVVELEREGFDKVFVFFTSIFNVEVTRWKVRVSVVIRAQGNLEKLCQF
jgi:hypothetical protein